MPFLIYCVNNVNRIGFQMLNQRCIPKINLQSPVLSVYLLEFCLEVLDLFHDTEGQVIFIS